MVLSKWFATISQLLLCSPGKRMIRYLSFELVRNNILGHAKLLHTVQCTERRSAFRIKLTALTGHSPSVSGDTILFGSFSMNLHHFHQPIVVCGTWFFFHSWGIFKNFEEFHMRGKKLCRQQSVGVSDAVKKLPRTSGKEQMNALASKFKFFTTPPFPFKWDFLKLGRLLVQLYFEDYGNIIDTSMYH